MECQQFIFVHDLITIVCTVLQSAAVQSLDCNKEADQDRSYRALVHSVCVLLFAAVTQGGKKQQHPVVLKKTFKACRPVIYVNVCIDKEKINELLLANTISKESFLPSLMKINTRTHTRRLPAHVNNLQKEHPTPCEFQVCHGRLATQLHMHLLAAHYVELQNRAGEASSVEDCLMYTP